MELAGTHGASQPRNLLYAYKERMDKNRFIQNLLLDNLLLVDIYNQIGNGVYLTEGIYFPGKEKIPGQKLRGLYLQSNRKRRETFWYRKP